MIVGSTDWTDAGAYDNAENTVVLHDRELARAYDAEHPLVGDGAVGEGGNAVKVWLPVVFQSTPA